MSRKEHLQAISDSTMAAIEERGYLNGRGKFVDLSKGLDLQAQGNLYYGPERVVGAPDPAPGAMDIHVDDADAVTALLRMGDDTTPACCLVFASARRPGGGFLDGANAQEESIARSSTLPMSLLATTQFYEPHRADRDLRYSDALIYTPDARIIRDGSLRLLDVPVRCAFITAAAPNAGAMERNQRQDLRTVPEVFRRRVKRVLSVAALHGHRRLVLGAWGCGVFGNDPAMVARTFRQALQGMPAFDEVVFAIPGIGSEHHRVFRACFG